MRLVPNAVLFAHISTMPLPQEHVKWDVDRESNSKKLSDLFERKDELMREMRHQMHVAAWFRRWPAVAWFARRVEVASTMAFWLAILINFLILGCYQVKRCTACAMCCHRTDCCLLGVLAAQADSPVGGLAQVSCQNKVRPTPLYSCNCYPSPSSPSVSHTVSGQEHGLL